MKAVFPAVLLVALLGCDGEASTDPHTASHVFEDLLAALDIEGPVGVYESWENIPDPDLAAEIREYAERAEMVLTCDSRTCAGPEYPISVKFSEWSWTPSPDLPTRIVDLGGVYESWQRTGDRFDPIIRGGGGVQVEIEWSDCMCGSIMAVEITREQDGGWSVGKAEQIGMSMS